MHRIVGGRSSRLLASRGAAVAWTVIIVALCLLPGEDVPKVDVVGIDKVGHFLMFVVFSLLWWQHISNRPIVRLLVFGLVLAVGTELLQGVLNWGRIGDPFDAIANAAGLAVGIAIAHRRLSHGGAG